MYYFALISSVVLACSEEKRGRGDTDDVSAVEAYDYLMDAAKHTPIYAQIFSEMRTAETVFLMHQSKEQADADMFVCALKFAAPLFTTNHATKYTFILAKFFQWWECSSDADKKIYEKLLMTKKTENGKNIFVDRFVEWLVKDLRGGGLGKFYRKGTDRKLERDAVLVSKRREFKAALRRDLNRMKSNSDGTFQNVGGVYCLSLVYFDEIGLWKKRDANLLQIDSASPIMNPEMIDWYVRGERRMDSYIHYRLRETPMSDEEEVKDSQLLRCIEPTTNARADRNAINKSRSTSTTVDFVVQNYTQKELKQVTKSTTVEWKQLYPNIALPYKRKSDKKTELATLICRMREKFIADNPQWTSATIQSISEQIISDEAAINNTVTERLANVCESRYMSLCINDANNTKVQELRDAYSTKYLSCNSSTAATSTTDAVEDLSVLLSFGL